jgi:hypothetical protein
MAEAHAIARAADVSKAELSVRYCCRAVKQAQTQDRQMLAATCTDTQGAKAEAAAQPLQPAPAVIKACNEALRASLTVHQHELGI